MCRINKRSESGTIPARKSGWIEIPVRRAYRRGLHSRSQERVDRNMPTVGIIQTIHSRSQERVDRNPMNTDVKSEPLFPLARAGG